MEDIKRLNSWETIKQMIISDDHRDNTCTDTYMENFL